VAEAPGTHAGGIGGLIALLRDHGAAIEADLKRFYGATLSDLTRGRLTWRQLSVYLRGLPKESATAREIGGPDLEWGLAEHLLAATFDALQVANWQRAARKSKAPKPTPRPGVRDDAQKVGKTNRSPEEVMAYLAQFAPKAKEANGGD
jgi:hypothetical protein